MKNVQTILVTGGAGFIGLNFISYFAYKYPNITIINLDKLTYAADTAELKNVRELPNHIFIEGDICDRQLVERLFKEHDIQGVIHFAAESHVDRSIDGPEAFIQTNINGTFTLLDVAKNHWMTRAGEVRSGYESARFHHISTDEVYGSLGKTGLFSEHSPYAPNSPYSASKASSDMLVRSYFHTYGMNVVTTQCSNNYGPKQHSEKLIPTIIRKALQLEPIPIYGDGQNIRDWLYVLDHCKGIDLVFQEGRKGETYNIGGNNERTNLYIAKKICKHLDSLAPKAKRNAKMESYEDLITFVEDRPGHDRRYAVDASKIENELGWQAEENFESGILKTVEWYVNHAKY
ncbi:dTDP-glucose 4,6-dehydratase [Alteribacillus bidgolensis]|uniref:dTDP-glucose 4,6-dehydratase n=1 Tax=Alteribacillus bidgolensis TaxID=930129 RepID=A0A1G8QE45_9BACI|nr:dTDP-glucose 4,6-dehydratase [Alteribacillus bidgolensis]SDJ02843.1 dTDP-glucose 4,6-dehydratase [Alteribacillus bidgolensis]